MVELIDKMKQYGINKIILDGNCGSVILNGDKLEYDYRYALRYYTYTNRAFEVAYDRLIKHITDIEDFMRNKGKIYETTMFHKEYDSDMIKYNRVVTKFTYQSDIVDSGVTIKDTNVVVGNINQLRKFKVYTNNHNRYCRCCEIYMNEKVEQLLALGGIFIGLFENYDSFMEYYHNSIVD